MAKTGTKKTGTTPFICRKSKNILKVLMCNPSGLTAKNIIRLTGIKRRTTYNNLNSLIRNKLIIYIRPIYKCATLQAGYTKLAQLLKSDKIQAHKYSFILRLVSKPAWWENRHNRLSKIKEYHYRSVDWSNSYQQLHHENFLIQAFSNSIVFINQKKYFGIDSYASFIESLEDTLSALEYFEESVKFKFFKLTVPQLSVRSHHYVKLRDELAQKCKKTGRLFKLEINGKLRAWIDLSEPFGIEFGHKNYAAEDANRYTKVVDDYIEGNASLPLDVDKRINSLLLAIEKINQNMVMYAENQKTHLKYVNALGTAINKLTKKIDKLP